MDPISTQSAPQQPSAPSVGNGRRVLLLIAGIPLIVVLAASWMWYFVANGDLDVVDALGTANRGQLVQPPRQAMEGGWTNAGGEPFAPTSQALWTLVVVQRGANCDARCEQRLYETRQIHMALGKGMGRVQRALVTDTSFGDLRFTAPNLSDGRDVPEDFPAYLRLEQRGMQVWLAPAAAMDTLFVEQRDNADSWYLMDPAGWIMMRYDPSISYKGVITDLKFLIKNSNG
ncbi:MAG: hypothetical protein ACI87W_000552 [Halieaceae bacterium]